MLLHEGFRVIVLLSEESITGGGDGRDRAVLQDDTLRSEDSPPFICIFLSGEGEGQIYGAGGYLEASLLVRSLSLSRVDNVSEGDRNPPETLPDVHHGVGVLLARPGLGEQFSIW